MARQLTLIDTHPTWRLSEKTRQAGLRGIAAARAELQAHKPAEEQRSHAA
ncbi:hypothetical protein KSP35_00965 [Aquihabitans sp. G128]|nr:hypothetical protein [Aquihabitans sp. G128]QXC61453.1 hypothetical protein KSP35_00965 [Aquihabitans sp. G128]